MTRAQIRDNVRVNLGDAGITFYSDQEINESIQDAYNEVVAKTLCNIKSVTYPWSSVGGNYIDFVSDFALVDYIGTYAIFNNLTNWWLRDDVSLRDFDRVRRDWENWRGTPMFWTPHSLKYIVVAPINVPGSGTFTLWYYTSAPPLTGDSSTPIIAADQHSLIEWYSTADLLESAEEIGKAGERWASYESNLMEYKERVHNIAKSDLLLRI